MAKGWRGESKRHDLSRQGIKTAQKVNMIPSRRGLELRRQKTVTEKIKQMGKSDTLPFTETKIKTFHLPIETAIYIPSTTKGQKKLSDSQFKSRVRQSQDDLAKMFGGFSTVKVTGGFTTDDGNVVRENVAKVVVFTTDESLLKNQQALRDWLLKKQAEWHQESMGFEIEGDLYYVEKR